MVYIMPTEEKTEIPKYRGKYTYDKGVLNVTDYEFQSNKVWIGAAGFSIIFSSKTNGYVPSGKNDFTIIKRID